MDYLIFLINLFFQVYICLIAIRALLPWVPHNRFNPIISFIYEVTEPLLLPIRKGTPPTKFGIDASPFIAIFFLWIFMQIIGIILRLA